jgi:FkbM family methyltransferase
MLVSVQSMRKRFISKSDTPKSLVRKLFSTVDVYPFRRSTMPGGIVLEIDLERLFPRISSLMIFDVGANVGQTARYFSRHFPSAEIHSFEPIASSYNSLMSINQENPRLHPHHLAMGEKDGTAIMQVNCLEHSGLNRVIDVSQDDDPLPTETVNMARVDSFCRDNKIERIHLLKTDCEGYDLQVLNGAENMLSANRVDCVYCEVDFGHNNERGDVHADFFQIQSYLRPFGFTFYALYDYSFCDISTLHFSNALFVGNGICAQKR